MRFRIAHVLKKIAGKFKTAFGRNKIKQNFSADISEKEYTSTLTLTKPKENPILMPREENTWETWQVFNPGVIILDDKVHFLYRAIGQDGLSRLGYATSPDGYEITQRLDMPAYEHCYKGLSTPINYYSYSSGGSFGGCEDPRIVRVGEEEKLYMTYTACDNGLRVALTSISVRDFLEHKWNWSEPKLISKEGEVHKNWVIFPDKINGKYAILHSISPEILINYTDSLEFEQDVCIESHYESGSKCKNCWDSWVRGAGPPPIKTKDGWLLFYHAMDHRDPGKYKLGVMLLDLNDPTKILVRAQEPVLEPSEEYENNGFKAGVVYAVGSVVKDGNLMVYYGGADSYVCVAHAPLDEFLDSLKESMKPKFSKQKLKKKK